MSGTLFSPGLIIAIMLLQAYYCYYIVIIGNLKERGHFEDLGLDGMMILKMDLREVFCGGWTGFIWIRIGKGARLF
jgi:hypothetical protein